MPPEMVTWSDLPIPR